MLSLDFAVLSSGLVIILRFDGSFRPPRDPIPGFRHTANVIQVDGSTKNESGGDATKLALCSATISLVKFMAPNQCSEPEIMHAIGGKYLPIEIGMTSAHSEYEGLLLGLDYLVEAFSSPIPGKAPLLPDTNQFYSQNATLMVRGDCKTVIDQMNSKSTPRKMEQHYNSAMSKIEKIRQLYTDCCNQRLNSGDIDSTYRQLNVRYEHIPRELNYVCDKICKMIMQHVQIMHVISIRDRVMAGHVQENLISSELSSMIPQQLPFFKDALREIRYNPQLCHSTRLAMACFLATICKSNALILDQLSTFFGIMARNWSKIYYSAEGQDDAIALDAKKTLKRLSVACEKLSKGRPISMNSYRNDLDYITALTTRETDWYKDVYNVMGLSLLESEKRSMAAFERFFVEDDRDLNQKLFSTFGLWATGMSCIGKSGDLEFSTQTNSICK